MQVSNIPTKLDIIFASTATTAYVRVIPDSTSDPNAASWTLGFPPNTFVDPGSGGSPPDGRDFNGLFKMISAWTRWANAGGPIFYDATFAAQIGGYPRWTMLSATGAVGQFWINNADNNTSNPDAGGANWISFPPAAPANVTSFNGRQFAVTLNQTDVINALGNNSIPLGRLQYGGTGPLILGIPSGTSGAPTYNPASSYGINAPTAILLQNAQGSGGGSGESLAGNNWNQRVLNAVPYNNISGVSLSGNQLFLPAGNYMAQATAFASKLDSNGFLVHRLRIRNNTGGYTLIAGNQCASLGYAGSTEIGVWAVLNGPFGLSSGSWIELDSWVTSSGSGGGNSSFSPPSNSGENEVYVSLSLVKIA